MTLLHNDEEVKRREVFRGKDEEDGKEEVLRGNDSEIVYYNLRGYENSLGRSILCFWQTRWISLVRDFKPVRRRLAHITQRS